MLPQNTSVLICRFSFRLCQGRKKWVCSERDHRNRTGPFCKGTLGVDCCTHLTRQRILCSYSEHGVCPQALILWRNIRRFWFHILDVWRNDRRSVMPPFFCYFIRAILKAVYVKLETDVLCGRFSLVHTECKPLDNQWTLFVTDSELIYWVLSVLWNMYFNSFITSGLSDYPRSVGAIGPNESRSMCQRCFSFRLVMLICLIHFLHGTFSVNPTLVNSPGSLGNGAAFSLGMLLRWTV